MVLPPTKQLQSGPVRLEDGTLTSAYRLAPASSGATGLRINTYIRRIEGIDPPDEVDYVVHYPSESLEMDTAT